jgi:paraquat-inducible protein B
VLLAQAHVRLLNRKYNLDHTYLRTVLVPQPDRRGVVRWEEFAVQEIEPGALDAKPAPRAVFDSLTGPLADARLLTSLRKDFLEWVFRTGQVTVRANEALGVYAGPEVSQADFRRQVAEAARQKRDADLAKIAAGFDRKLDSLRAKLAREERELAEDQTELAQRKMEEMGTHAENIFGLFTRRRTRTLSTSLTKRRLTEKAKSDVQESLEAIKDFQAQIARLESEKAAALGEARQRWGDTAQQDAEIRVAPLKKDVLLDLFGIAWVPYYLVQVGENTLELPGWRP